MLVTEPPGERNREPLLGEGQPGAFDEAADAREGQADLLGQGEHGRGAARRAFRPAPASPIVPLTHKASPAAAPAREGTGPAACPSAVRPSTREGAETLSPPSSGMPKAASAAPRPTANARSHSSSPRVKPSSTPIGRAPLAARSERFTATSFQATSAGGSSGR